MATSPGANELKTAAFKENSNSSYLIDMVEITSLFRPIAVTHSDAVFRQLR